MNDRKVVYDQTVKTMVVLAKRATSTPGSVSASPSSCPDHGKPLPGSAPSPFHQLSIFSTN